MAKIRTRKLSDVPPPPPRLPEYRNKRFHADELERYILGLAVGSAIEIRLEDGDDMRDLKLRLKRLADRTRRPLRIWDSKGKLYFSLEEDQ